MIGKIFIYITVIASLLSVILYFLSDKKIELKKYANWLFYLSAASIIGASLYLLANIMSNNFQFTYIWEYSSIELHDFFLIASFYSGQQGSFLLWLLILVITGLFLQQSSRKNNLDSYAMGIYAFVIFFVALILVFKSPFEYVWETFANENIEVGFTPPNGRGLNPILQNYWINIHPPILFIGYTLMTIPFAYALAALIKKEYRKWIDYVYSWTLVGAGILGLGIMLGGFWAYETLGWGGFWAWDPVENSSLIPWIFIVAFIHTIIVQRKTNGLIKTNFILGIMSFIFVLYATFLTRSGVLGDTSVHSFVTPGAIVYNLLLLFMITFTLLGIFFVIYRIKDINNYNVKSNFKPLSKEYSLSLGSLLLVALALVIIIGTSWPAVAEWFGQTKAAIDIENYNKFGSAFAFIFLILNALSLYQKWQNNQITDLLKTIMIPLISSVILTGALLIFGMKDLTYLFLTFTAIFSLLTNTEFLLKRIVKRPSATGAYISHIGIAMIILGAIASGVYSSESSLRLKKGETKSLYGYDFTFVGKDRIEQEFTDREKYNYNVKVSKNQTNKVLKTVVYWSNFNDWQAPFLEPGIYTKFQQDIYVAPKSIETDLDVNRLMLMKNETAAIPDFDNLTLTVQSLNMDEQPTPDGSVVLSIVLKTASHSEESIDTINAKIDPTSWEGSLENWKTIDKFGIDVNMIRIVRDMQDVSKSKLDFLIKSRGEPIPQPIDVFAFDVTIKPLIILVWIGTILMFIGFFIALFKLPKKQNYNIAQ